MTDRTEYGNRAADSGPRTVDLLALQIRNRQARARAPSCASRWTSGRIGMAVGILLARLRCSEEEAFAVLRREGMRRNVKVAELAEHIVYTGTL